MLNGTALINHGGRKEALETFSHSGMAHLYFNSAVVKMYVKENADTSSMGSPRMNVFNTWNPTPSRSVSRVT